MVFDQENGDIRELIKQAIEYAGSLTQLAIKTKVTYQTAMDWKHGRRTPSAANAKRIELATNGLIKARDLRPDFPWDEEKIH